jgi:hypothetical protein
MKSKEKKPAKEILAEVIIALPMIILFIYGIVDHFNKS